MSDLHDGDQPIPMNPAYEQNRLDRKIKKEEKLNENLACKAIFGVDFRT